MNIREREREIINKLKMISYKRLVSYHDLSIGNKIMNVIDLNRKK